MDISVLQKRFSQIGARARLANGPVHRNRFRNRTSTDRLRLDIRHDRRGEYFELRLPDSETPDVWVVDARPREQHLLLLVRERGEKNKYLCGYDERHWFVAGVPESAPAGNVFQALDALQPAVVRYEVAHQHLRAKKKHRRKNAAFKRQGEWFFVPVEDAPTDEEWILRNEPLSRGIGSKPHIVDYCYRQGGEPVYVSRRYPRGLSSRDYHKLIAKNPSAERWYWQHMQRNPFVLVRGRVRHPDHATIKLSQWHRVLMNTENESRAMSNVVFLD